MFELLVVLSCVIGMCYEFVELLEIKVDRFVLVSVRVLFGVVGSKFVREVLF